MSKRILRVITSLQPNLFGTLAEKKASSISKNIKVAARNHKLDEEELIDFTVSAMMDGAPICSSTPNVCGRNLSMEIHAKKSEKEIKKEIEAKKKETAKIEAANKKAADKLEAEQKKEAEKKLVADKKAAEQKEADQKKADEKKAADEKKNSDKIAAKSDSGKTSGTKSEDDKKTGQDKAKDIEEQEKNIPN